MPAILKLILTIAQIITERIIRRLLKNGGYRKETT